MGSQIFVPPRPSSGTKSKGKMQTPSISARDHACEARKSLEGRPIERVQLQSEVSVHAQESSRVSDAE